ncbi:hypothetical protein EIMP300_27310 [Escherichia coli]|uniref:Amidohydrolase n=1 Tax=Escherichia coli TaxID=562 RepID=A0A8S0FMF5_ECOLX|nr:hypothetical protein EIMP300_27310 [Escherichia coli]
MLILKNVTAVQLHPAKVQEGVDIAIENDVIVAIGDALTQRYPDASYKEMHGRIVMPGIVCSHNHFYSGLSRGIMANIAPCPDFISTLKNLWWRLDRALDEESLYYSGLICSLRHAEKRLRADVHRLSITMPLRRISTGRSPHCATHF